MHPIIQAEVDELKKQFPYITDEEVIAEPRNKDDGRRAELLTLMMRSDAKRLNDFVAAALHRAIEKSGKEEVMKFKDVIQERANTIPPNLLLNEVVNYAYDRSAALSKLDTIINFKE